MVRVLLVRDPHARHLGSMASAAVAIIGIQGLAEGRRLAHQPMPDVGRWSALPPRGPSRLVPVSGPVAALLRAQGRHNMRPAHIHFLIRKSGFKTQFSQLYSKDDPHLESDVQFGVTRALVGEYVRTDDGQGEA